MHTFDLIAPFGAGILIYLISPLLSLQVRSAIDRAIADGREHVTVAVDDKIPYYMTPASISDYVEYAIDAAQVFPVMLLPIVGSVYAFSAGVPTPVALSFLFTACVMAVGMTSWMVIRSPSDYVSRKWLGYSIISLIGMGVNVAGMVLVLAFN